jgi:DNA polymerase III delta prime subunit
MMNYQLFMHKYQPTRFRDFEIDSEIINILTTLIEMNNLNILFIGDTGSGKTSFVNALIREYYSTNSKYESNILHINSLKEQGINYYRNDVRTFSQTCSSISGKKKIIVLDDIDIINEQSQQVFRNCIDKYSHNVHFVCSCTNSQKVIESLQSRLVIIKIKQLSRPNLVNIMHKIRTNEGILFDQFAESFILDICNNNAKILINYMEKFKLMNMPITLEIAQNVCTNISFAAFEEYTHHLLEHRLIEAIHVMHSIYEKGYSVMDILDNYFLFIKITNILTENQKYKIIPLICKYITIFHNTHEHELELSLFTNNMFKLFNL